VVDEAVDHGRRHGGIGEDFAPVTERLICGDEDGAAFVARPFEPCSNSCSNKRATIPEGMARTDEFEQDAGLGMARQSRWQWSVNQDEMMLPGL
jgi:hypothetical protein